MLLLFFLLARIPVYFLYRVPTYTCLSTFICIFPQELNDCDVPTLFLGLFVVGFSGCFVARLGFLPFIAQESSVNMNPANHFLLLCGWECRDWLIVVLGGRWLVGLSHQSFYAFHQLLLNLGVCSQVYQQTLKLD